MPGSRRSNGVATQGGPPVELTQLEWAGGTLRPVGTIALDTGDIVARAETNGCSVLYLRSGGKLFVLETLEHLDRLAFQNVVRREVTKRFKRSIRAAKASGTSVHKAFATLWEHIVTTAHLPEHELAQLYKELLEWTRRWLR